MRNEIIIELFIVFIIVFFLYILYCVMILFGFSGGFYVIRILVCLFLLFVRVSSEGEGCFFGVVFRVLVLIFLLSL